MTEVFEFEEEATIEATFQIGVTAEDHGALYNRDAPNQHPISAITDLQTTLDGISGDISAETTRAEGAEGNLENLTTTDKTNLVSAINEVDSHADTNATNLSNHIADKNNPHEVTKTQVGLGNCDNTADLDKPISTATQNALNLKVNTADLGNAELDIQKNGTSVGKFTANASVDKVINLVIPTQASDVNALPDSTKYGASLSLTINSSTYVVTAQLKDQDGNNLGSAQTIDLPLESVVVNGSYDSVNKKIVLTLENGNTIDIPVGDLVAGLQSEITVDNKLASDLVDDTNQTHKFATSTQLSQIATNTSDISNLQSGKADKATTLSGYGITDAYTKTEVDTALNGKQDNLTTAQLNAVNSGITSAKVTQYDGYSTSKANVGLDNLNADGQMIIDTVNGYISNCILEIPQDIKLELNNGTLTLKAGSKVYKPNGTNTFDIVNITTDKTYTYTVNGTWFLVAESNGNIARCRMKSYSGSTEPSPSGTGDLWYDTENNYVKRQSGQSWVNVSFPFAIVTVSNGAISSIDKVFNGACFVGHHAVVYPNVKRLRANGFNTDGRLSSVLNTTASLQIIEMYSNRNCILLDGVAGYYQEIDDLSQAYNSSWYLWYVKNLNFVGVYNNNTFTGRTYTPLVSFTLDNNNQVTNWTPRVSVRLATTEMLDKKQDTLTFDTTPTQSSTNPVTSGGVYTALGTKQDNLVSGTNIKTINSTSVLGSGNFTLADQSLSNLDSTGQMIVDSQNGTMSNCILEIPQNIKVTLSGNVLTMLSGSVLVNTGSTYATTTTTTDLTRTLSRTTEGRYVLFYQNGGLRNERLLSEVTSGDTAGIPTTYDNYTLYYNADDQEIYHKGTNGMEIWSDACYPIVLLDYASGVWSIAKDSYGNDIIFNGACYVGHHVLVYPNVNGLIASGFNADGTLKSIYTYIQGLQVTNHPNQQSVIAIRTNKQTRRDNLSLVEWREKENRWVVKANNSTYENVPFIFTNASGEVITQFDIVQPVRLATADMLYKKQDIITTITGYDATKTQTLKNVSGTLTWVDD